MDQSFGEHASLGRSPPHRYFVSIASVGSAQLWANAMEHGLFKAKSSDTRPDRGESPIGGAPRSEVAAMTKEPLAARKCVCRVGRRQRHKSSRRYQRMMTWPWCRRRRRRAVLKRPRGESECTGPRPQARRERRGAATVGVDPVGYGCCEREATQGRAPL